MPTYVRICPSQTSQRDGLLTFTRSCWPCCGKATTSGLSQHPAPIAVLSSINSAKTGAKKWSSLPWAKSSSLNLSIGQLRRETNKASPMPHQTSRNTSSLGFKISGERHMWKQRNFFRSQGCNPWQAACHNKDLLRKLDTRSSGVDSKF